MLQAFFRNIPPVVKNLLIINVLVFIAALTLDPEGTGYMGSLALYNPASGHFEPFQFITYMFMHGSFNHLFFNMLSLILIGSALEVDWGPKRFLTFYFITGIGAGILYSVLNYAEFVRLSAGLDPEVLEMIKTEGRDILFGMQNFRDNTIGDLNIVLNVPTVGASGALFGIMVAFGMLHPNTEFMLLFFPVPIKAKYFIPFMIALEFYLAIMQFAWDNVAHYAHLSGALLGAVMVLYWRKTDRRNFY